MAYESLSKVLAKYGETGAQIKRCLFVKLGGIALSSDKFVPGSGEESAFMEGLSKHLVKAIAAHPNVSTPTAVEHGEPLSMMTLTAPEFIASDRHFLFHVTVPRARLKYPPWSSGGDMEDFYGICTGSLFAAFREVDDYPARSGIGQELRELIHDQIQKETSITSPPLGPSPLRPDIYLVLRTPVAGTARARPAAVREAGNLIVVFDGGDIKSADLVEAFFASVERMLFAFYSEAMSRRRVDEATYRVLELFSDLARTSQQIFENPAWRFWRSRQLSRDAGAQIASIHQRLVERETEVLASNASRQEFATAIAGHPILGAIGNDLQHDLEPSRDIPASLTPALSYYESQMSLSANIRTLTLATILGATVGAVLGTTLTWILGRLGR